MKRQKDTRITVRRMDLKFYCILSALLFVVGLAFFGIYYTIPRGGFWNNVYAILALVTFVSVVAALLGAVVGVTYRHFISKPIDILSEAAKKVAAGDFTVRIAPLRHDGKKDEFEVLFDDFNTMTEELAATELLKKDFVSNVSHELKTPLSVIQNYSTMLQSDGISDRERIEYAANIGEATKRLSVLVTDILRLSRLENRKTAVDKSAYNLSEQLCRCLVGFESVWEEKNIEIDTCLDAGVQVYSSEELLDIVWNNLLSNALKFTPAGGKITVAMAQNAHGVTVSVQDNGCGIAEKDVKHIFDTFYQADTSHATQGNGLGLALVKRILLLTGCSVAVESVPGQGSTFTVTLPTADSIRE